MTLAPVIFVAIIAACYIPMTFAHGAPDRGPHPFTRAARWAWRTATTRRPRLACGHRADTTITIAHPVTGTRHRIATCNTCDLVVSLAPPTQHRPRPRHRLTRRLHCASIDPSNAL